MFALLHESRGKPTELVTFRDEPKVAERTQAIELRGRIAYSFCFDPDYADNGQLYLFSNLRMDKFDGGKANRISRFIVRREPEWSVDPASEHIILEWSSRGHDGGGIAFGHDGMLYISTGDGTSDSDKWLSGQTLDDLLGSVLRIDIRNSTPEKPYVIPADNPFIDLPNARPELFAYGLRNPWRLTIDTLTGQVWVGNNGQDLWETVHLVRPGENYGWSVYEGSHPFYINRKLGPHPLTLPTAEHPHSEARSITGGVVYYGAKWPDLRGHYIYGDYETGKIWGIKHDGEKVVSHRELADTSLAINFRRPTVHAMALFVTEQTSVIRQLARGEKIMAHNREVAETGVGATEELRKTDVDEEAARHRYRVFKEQTWDALTSLKEIYHYHFVNAEGPIQEVEHNIVRELQYQSSLELDPRTFERLRVLPLAQDITLHARQELIRRLDSYELDHRELFIRIIE
ncbi:MAG: hypothetical protein HOF22_15730, partial [Verrucomicrobia bacterium]|nr:hypothetical protein [Verrucomicrobiota bacterium]